MGWSGWRPQAVAVLCASLAVVVGCGRTSSSSPTAKRAAIPGMVQMYNQFVQEHGNKAPADEAEFRAFLAGQQTKLEQFELSVDDMFRSPRNGEAFTWLYGAAKSPIGPGGMRVLGYDAAPADGKRLVVGARGMREEIDEAEFKKLFPTAG